MATFSAEEPLAFLALPFSLAGSPVVKALTKTLHEHGVQIVSPQLAGEFPGVISEQILGMLRRADFVVADLTDRHPNVFFELGLAIGLGKPVLLLSQESAADIPFDLRARQVVVYRPDQLDTISRYIDLWLRDLLAAAHRRAVANQ
jgi:nucleoside 2-deoxyribosyltransferase